MGVLNRETREIHAKIVYYGPEGAGKTANVEFIHRKLKREYRGELKSTQTRNGKDSYEFLPITLGTVRGFQTSIHIYTVPGGDDHAELRRQILDGVDGIVFVADLRPESHDAVLPSLAELQEHLASYGRSFDDVIFVMQYNRRDQVDENAVEALHRRVKLRPAASFETVASEGTGVLNALTTLSKQIISRIRQRAEAEDAAPPAASAAAPRRETPATAAAPAASPAASQPLATAAPEAPAANAAPRFRVESGGVPSVGADGMMRIPVRLVDETSGQSVGLSLRVAIDTTG